MTQGIKIENMKDGGPYDIILMVMNKVAKGPDSLETMKTLKPGESEEIYIHGGKYIAIVE